jgi:hypothetical protein
MKALFGRLSGYTGMINPGVGEETGAPFAALSFHIAQEREKQDEESMALPAPGTQHPTDGLTGHVVQIGRKCFDVIHEPMVRSGIAIYIT